MIPEAQTRRRIMWLLFVGVLMAALDIAIVGPALPAIEQAFTLTARDVTWVFSIYVLFNLLGTPLLAALSDSLGRRNIFLFALILFTVGSLLVAISPDYPVLLLGRAIQGFGAGGIFPVASALVWDTFPANTRGKMLGLLGAVFGLAFLVGPILGGILLLFNWHLLFLVNVPIGIVILYIGFRTLPKSTALPKKTFDWPGMLLLSGILASLLLGLSRIDTTNVLNSLMQLGTWLLLLLCIVLIPLFVRVERSATNPIVQVRLFSRRQVLLASALAVGAGLAEAALVFVPALLKARFSVSESSASFMLLPLVVAMAFTSPTAGRFIDRVGPRPVLLIGTTLIALGMLLTSLSGLTMPLFYVASVLLGIGLACLLGAPLRYIMLSEASPGATASTQGVLTLLISTGQLFGGVLIGVIAASQGSGVTGFQEAFLLMSAVGLLLILSAFLLKKRTKEAVAPVPADYKDDKTRLSQT